MIRDTLTDEQLSALLSAARANLEMQRIFGSVEVIEECRLLLLALEELGRLRLTNWRRGSTQLFQQNS